MSRTGSGFHHANRPAQHGFRARRHARKYPGGHQHAIDPTMPLESSTLPDAQAVEDHVIQAFEAISAETCRLLSTSRKEWTTCIKNKLAALGSTLNFSVNAHGCKDAHEGEWLYDMTWSVLDASKYGNLMRQPLALESEWQPDAIMDNDFHKLVQARAEVRVWVFTAANKVDVDSYVERCRELACGFAGSLAGDRYVLVGYEWEHRSASIHTFQLG
ncbi:hypothetical protein RQP53_15920 [Paucibacter sp. APW11]|uniref:Bacterial HORMA domain-containing protein n=1 Tax=Roseateles aquae TaxID=3077235 RepID=A0ABU3PDW9_9BURK|nr:hypothetical protein [Paucibacter sp. APW11]MDT9000764.1 hypothetical protein [Paucibacter sp. APW11]